MEPCATTALMSVSASEGVARPPSVVLSYGMGADSTALLLRWLTEPSSRDFDLDELVVVSSMTGNEFDSTREAVETHVLPRLAEQGVRFVQVARSQRRTTRAGDGVIVLNDSRQPERLYFEGAYTLGQEMLSAGTVPQRGGMRMCSVHSKGDCLDPVIARITQGRPYRHAIGFEANEQARVAKDRLYDNSFRVGFYPLVEWGWARADCQRFLVDLVGVAFPKSACGFCPFAMGSESGRARQVERYRQEPAIGAEALFLEHVARSLNPAQTLIEASSAAEMVAAAGLHEVQDRFDTLLEATDWALYEVRRLTRPGRDGKRGITARSVRVLARGSRTDMAAALRAQPGCRIVGDDAVVRHIVRERSSDGVDELYVAAPAGVESKQRKGFETWFQEATGDGLF